MTFTYTQKEIDYLSKKDKKLAAAIQKIGLIEREVEPDTFIALLRSVVSQQISKKSAQTVWTRLLALAQLMSPTSIDALEIEAIQKCGMSMRKALYIKGIANAAKTGAVDFDALGNMTDDDVIATLSALDGIGVWTAQMLLIFSLCRKDVLSWGDLAIRRGICTLYGHEKLTKDQFEKYKKRYSPYASVASLYLWELSH